MDFRANDGDYFKVVMIGDGVNFELPKEERDELLRPDFNNLQRTRLVSGVDSLPAAEQPVCWFLAGAALLDVGSSDRRGVDLPKVRSTYWPHRVNFDRLSRSRIDWRLLCPGPMVDEPALGLDRLRISLDALPVQVSAFTRALPGLLLLPVFASLIPQMIVSYADAAALMLANLDRCSAMSRHRVGLALPEGMRGRKSRWSAKVNPTAQ